LFSISKTIAPSAAAFALFITGMSAESALAGTIVVRSSGPSAKTYPPGKSIVDGSKVTLKAGDTLTILDGRGASVLKGPGVFATTTATASSTAITAMLRNTGKRIGRTGAVRGAGQPPSLWLIDPTSSGTMCVPDAQSVKFWRSGSDKPATLTVTRVSDGKTIPVVFKIGFSEAGWAPQDMPVDFGSKYRVSGDGLSAPSTIQFADMGPNAAGIETTISSLVKMGCDAQLKRLVDTLAVQGGESTPTS
jgi:hypothetical protein